MDRKVMRIGDYQLGTIVPREPQIGPSTNTPSASQNVPSTLSPKLLTEPNAQKRHQECSSATLPIHILQPYREDDKVPMFLIKMWNILEDPKFQKIICWDKSGYSFHILDPHSFCRVVLPQFFKHNNLNSLIRQLNMYGFRKMTPIDRSSLARAESDQDHLEFSHPNFIQQHPDLLINIKRKTPASRNNENNAMTVPAKEISLLVDEIRQLREKQRVMENKMTHLVKENEAMWQQMSHLRSQHVKQQHVVNKLVQFLVALVQPSQKRLGKRNLLAIDETGNKRARMASTNAAQQIQQSSNLSEIIDRLQREITEGTTSQTTSKVNPFNPCSIQGPIIADVTDEPENATTPAAVVPTLTVIGHQPPSNALPPNPSNPSVAFNPISLSPSLERQISEELAEYLSGQEQTIDTCRDWLGNYWDNMMADGPEDDEECHQQQPLMLEGGDPVLALNEAPTTPDLLTPLASPSSNNLDIK